MQAAVSQVWNLRGRDFDRDVVRDALLRDLRQRANIDPALAEVDFVVFSGDAAWQGKAEEYQSARACLFEPVLTELGLPPTKLFIVPGNHDLSRAHVEEFLSAALQQPLESDEQVRKWLTDDKRRGYALGPFDDFTAFVTGFTGQKPPAYANTWTGFIGSKRVGILCLNSAWMCGRKKESDGEVNDTNAYNFVRLDFDSGQGAIFLRRWSDRRNEWIEDTDAHPGGRLRFRLPKELGAAPAPSPG